MPNVDVFICNTDPFCTNIIVFGEIVKFIRKKILQTKKRLKDTHE